MMISHVVTDSLLGASLLKAITVRCLPVEDGCVRFNPTSGSSSADSLARTILTVRKEPVVLVVDADTTNPERVEEATRFLEYSLGDCAPASLWKVVVVVPEIEAILFKDRAVLEQLVGAPVTENHLFRARYEPRLVLEELLGPEPNDQKILIERFASVDLRPLADVQPVSDLLEFLARVTQKAAA